MIKSPLLLVVVVVAIAAVFVVDAQCRSVICHSLTLRRPVRRRPVAKLEDAPAVDLVVQPAAEFIAEATDEQRVQEGDYFVELPATEQVEEPGVELGPIVEQEIVADYQLELDPIDLQVLDVELPDPPVESSRVFNNDLDGNPPEADTPAVRQLIDDGEMPDTPTEDGLPELPTEEDVPELPTEKDAAEVPAEEELPDDPELPDEPVGPDDAETPTAISQEPSRYGSIPSPTPGAGYNSNGGVAPAYSTPPPTRVDTSYQQQSGRRPTGSTFAGGADRTRFNNNNQQQQQQQRQQQLDDRQRQLDDRQRQRETDLARRRAEQQEKQRRSRLQAEGRRKMAEARRYAHIVDREMTKAERFRDMASTADGRAADAQSKRASAQAEADRILGQSRNDNNFNNNNNNFNSNTNNNFNNNNNFNSNYNNNPNSNNNNYNSSPPPFVQPTVGSAYNNPSVGNAGPKQPQPSIVAETTYRGRRRIGKWTFRGR